MDTFINSQLEGSFMEMNPPEFVAANLGIINDGL